MKTLVLFGGSGLAFIATLLVTIAGGGLPEQAAAQQPGLNPLQRKIDEADRDKPEAAKAGLDKKLDQILAKLEQMDKRLTEIENVLARGNASRNGSGPGRTREDGAVRIVGRVTIDGKPLAGATVNFLAAKGDRTVAKDTTNEDGNFQLKAGLRPGQYRVFVASPKVAILGRYGDPEKTALKVEVPAEGPVTLDLSLQSR